MLTNEQLHQVVQAGILLTTEKNRNKLLDEILTIAMDISSCDAGTLYLYKDNALEFRVMKTRSMGVDKGANGEKIDLPPVPFEEGNICAYCAIHDKIINIPDVYESEEFDFTGPKKYDQLTGYRTGSMLVMPMRNMEDELVGVLQLMNAGGDNKTSVPFSEDMELMIEAIGSQAAVATSNMAYTDEIREQMHSFVEAFTTAVDERTPYNATHTRKVASYSLQLANQINKKNKAGEIEEAFDDKRLEVLELAAMLHDIGKMIVPLKVMNKPDRLGKALAQVENRFELIGAYLRIDHLSGKISDADYETKKKELSEALEFVQANNNAGFFDDDKLAYVKELSELKYVKEDGTIIPYFTEYEIECLSIRKGTLTADERAQMESHVVMTGKILDKVRLSGRYAKVRDFAANHHEFLNGQGYPNHLTADALELEVRIITVCDVYDALTSSDRPYKKPMPKEKAFAILKDMAEHGQMEMRLVEWLEEALAENE